MISKDDIQRIAALAMLELKDNDVDKFVEQFNEILEYMKDIDSLDLSNQEAAFHISDLNNVFREDVVLKSLDNSVALKNAPEAGDGAFKVPKVI
jgi:aspartyl-tRNA(Asn)/glutamyl-tRNA(Gln) amidotransferase subunit C